MRRYGWSAAALAGMAVCAPRVHAQQSLLVDQYLTADIPGLAVEPGVTVLSRQRPEYDPLGIRLGEVTIRPELDETTGFDSNVLGQPAAKGSVVVETNAKVQALYDHSDTSAFVTATVDDNRFPQQSRQDYTNYTFSLGGTHQFGRDALTVNYTHLNLNQTVRDLDTPNLNKALPYQIDTGTIDYRFNLARTFIQPGITVSHYSYANGQVNGLPYVQTYRDRTVVQPNVTLGYELAPRRDLVLVVRDALAGYDNKLAGLPGRDYNDIAVLGGLDFADGGPFRYRVLAGYEARQFKNAALKSIQAPVVEAVVYWTPQGLTTVTGTAYRRIQDSSDETTIGVTETALSLRVDHEYLPNVILQANGGYYVDNYARGQGSQQLYVVGTGFTWLLNRNMRLVGTYDYTRRTSNGAINVGTVGGVSVGSLTGLPIGSNYSEHRFLLQVRFAL